MENDADRAPLTPEQMEKVRQIMDGMSCGKAFACLQKGFKRLCKSRDHGLEGFLDCMEPQTTHCVFRVPFGGAHFCRCPLRVYLKKEMDL